LTGLQDFHDRLLTGLQDFHDRLLTGLQDGHDDGCLPAVGLLRRSSSATKAVPWRRPDGWWV